jgi:biotin carboxylase
MEKILIICGGIHQIPLIKKAKELGFYVINSNLYENSPAFPFADETVVLDVLDVEGNYLYAQSHQVKGIVSDQSELSVKTVAEVSERLGLQTITLQNATLFTDKYDMRDFCKKHGFSHPAYCKCSSLKEVKDYFQMTKKKSIMKPLDSFSSRGVIIVENLSNLEEIFELSRSYSRDKTSVIIEDYLEGTEFTIDALVLDGKVFNLAISEKEHFLHNQSIACTLNFSYQNSNFDYDALRNLNRKLLEKTNLSFGLTHCEYKYTNGEFVLIEMAARGGGAYIASKIVPYLSGVDNYAYYLKFAMNMPLPYNYDSMIEKAIVKNRNRVASLRFFDFDSAGKAVREIHGVEKITSCKNILHFELNFKEGDVIQKAIDDSTRCGYYIVAAENRNDLKSCIAFVENTLKIIY